MTDDSHAEKIRDAFARAIKAARQRQGMTQLELAKRLDVSLDHVSKLERAKYMPSIATAAIFIRELGLDANELIDATPYRREASRRRLDREAEAISVVEELSDTDLELAIEILNSIHKRKPKDRRD